MGVTYIGLNTIDQPIVCSGTPSYYHDYTSISTDLTQGTSYLMMVEVASVTYGINVKIWIDYNHNNVFDAATETAGSGTCSAASSAMIPFTVSASSLTGTTGLRVMSNYYGYPTDPCGTETFGNCVDFSVNIQPSATPPTVTTNAASGIMNAEATLNGTANPNNNSAASYFDYGTSVSYGKTIKASPLVNSGNSPVVISGVVSGLQPNTV